MTRWNTGPLITSYIHMCAGLLWTAYFILNLHSLTSIVVCYCNGSPFESWLRWDSVTAASTWGFFKSGEESETNT